MYIDDRKPSRVVGSKLYYVKRIAKTCKWFAIAIILLLVAIALPMQLNNYELYTYRVFTFNFSDLETIIPVFSMIGTLAAVIVIWTQLQQMNSSTYMGLVGIIEKHHGKEATKLRQDLTNYYKEYIANVFKPEQYDSSDIKRLEELVQDCRTKFSGEITDNPDIEKKCMDVLSEVANYYESLSMFLEIGWADMHPTNRELLLSMLHNSSMKVAASLFILMPILKKSAIEDHWLSSFRIVLPKLLEYRKDIRQSTNTIDPLVDFLLKGKTGKLELPTISTNPKPTVGILGLGRVGKSTLSMIDLSNVSNIVVFDLNAKQIDVDYETKFNFVGSAKEMFECCNIIFVCIPSNQLDEYVSDSTLTALSSSTLLIKRTSSSYIFSKKAKKIYKHYVSFPCFIEYKQYGNVEDILLLGGENADIERIKGILKTMPSRQIMVVQSAESADQCKMVKFAIDHSLLMLWNEIFEWLNFAGAAESDIQSLMQFLYHQNSMSTCIRVPSGGNSNESLLLFEDSWSKENGMKMTKLALEINKKYTQYVGLSTFRFMMLREDKFLSQKALAEIKVSLEKFKEISRIQSVKS